MVNCEIFLNVFAAIRTVDLRYFFYGLSTFFDIINQKTGFAIGDNFPARTKVHGNDGYACGV